VFDCDFEDALLILSLN